MIRLLMFDFDGTLVDTANDLVNATNEYLHSLDIEPLSAATIKNHIGMGLQSLIKSNIAPEKLAQLSTEKVIADFLGVYNQHYLRTPKLFPYAEDFLRNWPHQLAIVSNKREAYIRPILDKLGLMDLPWIKILGGDSLQYKKPNALPLETCLEAAGVKAHEALMIGDGHPDMGAAKAARVKSVAVHFGYSPIEELREHSPDFELSCFRDLPRLIEDLHVSANNSQI